MLVTKHQYVKAWTQVSMILSSIRMTYLTRLRVAGRLNRPVQPQTNPKEEHEGYSCQRTPPYAKRHMVVVLEKNLQMVVR